MNYYDFGYLMIGQTVYSKYPFKN